MNRCKHCGKEIDDKHKFCNSSCAAKFNNARRERKPYESGFHVTWEGKREGSSLVWDLRIEGCESLVEKFI